MNTSCPPAQGMRTTRSPNLRAPTTVIRPAMSQTSSGYAGAPTLRAMSALTMKMPEPIMEPITSSVASISLSSRLNCTPPRESPGCSVFMAPPCRYGKTVTTGSVFSRRTGSALSRPNSRVEDQLGLQSRSATLESDDPRTTDTHTLGQLRLRPAPATAQLTDGDPHVTHRSHLHADSRT